MNSSTQRLQSEVKLIAELKTVIKNADALLKDTEQLSGEAYLAARINLVRTLDTAKMALAKFEDFKLATIIDAAYAANRFFRDQSGETVTLHAFD